MRDIILIFSVGGGVAAAVTGPLLALAFAVVGVLGRGAADQHASATASVALGLAAIGTGLGLPLAWTGWRALQGAPGHLFRPLSWWVWLTWFIVALAAGQAVVRVPRAALLMPLLQVAAGVLPALIFLALAAGAAAGRGGVLARRPMAGSLAWSGLGGTSLALLIELVLMLFGLVTVVLGLSVGEPTLAVRLQELARQMQETGRQPELSQLTELVSSPVFALAVIGFIGVLGPLIEEFLKGLAVPLVAGTGRRLRRIDGFLLGVAAGAGFAIVEGVLNGSLALRMTGMWAGLMVFRGAAAAMHCLASGLAGLGWQAILVERRWRRGLGLGLLAVTVHGAWNAAAVLIGLNAVQGAEADGIAAMARLGASGALVLLMAVIWFAAVAGLAVIPRWLITQEAAPSATESS